jgi:hypothetical protein
MLGAMRTWRWLLGAVVLGVALVACGPHASHAPAPDDLSAERLGDADRPGGILGALDEDERAAYDRSGMSGLSVAPGRDAEDLAALSEDDADRGSTKAGKIGFSIFVVAASLASAAAPFLLF